MADKIDLTGKRFVRLKVLEYSHSKKYKHCTKVYWRCICDCGNECVVCSDRLRSGKTKSCGCLRKEIACEYNDLIGMKFGRLVVLSFDHKDKFGERYWLCKCDCGNEKVIRGSSLTKGVTKSCGCFANERRIESHKKNNDYYIEENIAHFKDSNGNEFIVDTEDVDKIKDYCWSVNKSGYVDTKVNGKGIRLHRFIMNTPDDMIVDHINRKPWDNRKCNLRNTTVNVNTRNVSKGKNNTSGYLGVSLHKETGKWRAFVTVNGKTIHLGEFVNIEEAIDARKKGELKYYGEIIA